MSQPLEIRLNGKVAAGHILETKCLVDDSGIAANAQAALARKLPIARSEPVKPGRLAIVASGPSAADYIEEIRTFDEIWAINGAFCWLADIGTVPDVFFFMDPGKGCESLLTTVPSQATYLLSVLSDPAVFDRIKSVGPRLVKVWFPDVNSEFNAANYPDGTMLTPGGTTALTRAPFLAYQMGWRDMTVFGGDSSFTGSMYCYDSSRYECSVPPDVKWVLAPDGVTYATNVPMMHQVANLLGIVDRFGEGFGLKFRCGGLLNAMLNSPVSTLALEQDTRWKAFKRALARPVSRIRRAVGLPVGYKDRPSDA